MASKAADKSTEETQETENQQNDDESKPELSFGDVKFLLALTLVKNEVRDDKKVKFDDAKKIIDLIIHAGKDTTPGPKPILTKPDPPEGVIGKDEYKRLENLGLGRGVDVTKPYPWQSKSSFQVRKVDTDCKNIIGTEESGQTEFYEEEVNSVLTQQFNTNLTIEEPSNSLVIGIGAEHSRSFAETKKAVGVKVMTRTASFRTDCKDDDFEEKLSEWILERIATKQKWSLEQEDLIKLPGKGKGTSKERLEMYLTDVARKLAKDLPPEARKSSDRAAEKRAYRGTWELLQGCYDYVEQVGVTHYVHTIKLGAAKYEILTQETYNSKFTATPSFEVNKVAKAVLSANAGTNRTRTRKWKTMNSIGKIDPDKLTVKKEAPDEAVLEIELKPLHSRVHMRALHLALQWALKRYIQRRESRKEGPFLIACGPDNEGVTVYWQVIKDRQEVQGTTEIKKASLFYIIKTDDSKHPHEFYIGYVGNDLSTLEFPKGPADPKSKSRAVLAPIPQYITADLKMVGSSNQPLGVTAGTHKNHARFTLHSSAVRKYAFTRTPVDTDKWAEGGGYFINCARRMFKLDGYVAMVRHPVGDRNAAQTRRGGEGTELEEIKEEEQETDLGEGQQQEGAVGRAIKDSHIYTTTCKTSVKNHSNDWPWMVFHLLPGEHKDMTLKERKIQPEDLGEPLIDRSEYPIVYQSDARDFQFLFGNPTAQTMNSQ